MPQVTQTPPIQGSVVWKPPRVGLFKLNFDASVRQGTGTGMGMIVRDHQGQVLVAATYLSDVVMEIREVEATTFRWAIIKAGDLWLLGSQFETNCLNLYQCWNSREISGRNLSHRLVMDFRRLLHGSNENKLPFTKRQGNKAAHNLASLAFVFIDQCWIN